MVNEEQQDRSRAMLGAALAVLSHAAEESHLLDRVEIAPVTSTYHRYHDRTLAKSRLASDRAVAFWSEMQRDHSQRQYSWWGDAGSRSLLGKPVSVAELTSGRGEKQLIILHRQVMFLGFWLIVLIKVMSGCSWDYLSPKPHGGFVG